MLICSIFFSCWHLVSNQGHSGWHLLVWGPPEAGQGSVIDSPGSVHCWGPHLRGPNLRPHGTTQPSVFWGLKVWSGPQGSLLVHQGSTDSLPPSSSWGRHLGMIIWESKESWSGSSTSKECILWAVNSTYFFRWIVIFRLHFLCHIFFNFENLSVHVEANILNFPKYPQLLHFGWVGEYMKLWLFFH